MCRYRKLPVQLHLACLVDNMAAVENGAQQVSEVGPGDVILALHSRQHHVSTCRQVAGVEPALGSRRTVGKAQLVLASSNASVLHQLAVRPIWHTLQEQPITHE